jgi:hypothetical protein
MSFLTWIFRLRFSVFGLAAVAVAADMIGDGRVIGAIAVLAAAAAVEIWWEVACAISEGKP